MTDSASSRVLASAMVGPEAFGEWKVLVTWANRQPALANYARRPGAEHFTPVALNRF